MKKELVVLAATAVLWTGFAALSAQAVPEKNGVISVNSTVSKEYPPNVAQVSFSVKTTDKDMVKATNENKTAVQNALNAIKKNLNTQAGDQITTASYSVYPQYINTKDGKSVFDKYIVTNTIIVKTKDVNKIGSIITTATSNGINRVEDLNFMLEDYDKACNSLMAQAAQESKTKAQVLAQSIGLKIYQMNKIDGRCDSQNTQRFLYNQSAAKMASGYESDSAVPTEAGKIKLNATVDAEFLAN